MTHRRSTTLLWLRDLVSRVHDGRPAVPSIDADQQPVATVTVTLSANVAGRMVRYEFPTVDVSGLDGVLDVDVSADDPADRYYAAVDPVVPRFEVAPDKTLRIALVGRLVAGEGGVTHWTMRDADDLTPEVDP